MSRSNVYSRRSALVAAGLVACGVVLGACDRSDFVVPPNVAGDGSGPSGNGPVAPSSPAAGAAVFLSAGRAFSCARKGQALGCWGDPVIQRGLGVRADQAVGGANITFGGFSRVPILQVTAAAAEGDRVCLIEAGRLLCTVRDDASTSIEDSCRFLDDCGFTLSRLEGIVDPVTAVDVSVDHACAIVAGGRVVCWGRNDVGQLGHEPGAAADRPCPGGGMCNPVPTVVGGLENAVEVSVSSMAGRGVSCARTQGDKVYCWGANHFGQLGNEMTDEGVHPTPLLVPGQYRTVSVGASGVCAISLGSIVYCWGDYGGQLNLPGAMPRPVSRLTEATSGAWVDLSRAVAVSRGANHACALDADGRVWCWGSNIHGQLGRGRHPSFDGECTVDGMKGLCSTGGASRVESLTDVAAIAVGGRHTCAAKRDGSLWCWGSNSDGQVGLPVRAPEDARNYTSATSVQGSAL